MCGNGGEPFLKDMVEGLKRKDDKYWESINKINLMLFVKVKCVKFWFGMIRNWQMRC